VKPLYNIPKNSIFYQKTVKKSRFIVNISHTPDVISAKEFIAEVKIKYSDAAHNCWSFIAGPPTDTQVLGFSDNGEPNGTAGKPIFNVLHGSGIGEITAVVTRYYGGIKLGTGGLARAYGGIVKEALIDLKLSEKIQVLSLNGISKYSEQNAIEKVLDGYNVLNLEKEFSDIVSWKFLMDIRQANLAILEITDKTNGNVLFKISEKS